MAKVLSSISGNLISAASAGYAPTNSGDVSAIASGYQVVSSTATQLYAGTAYLTSVNGDALSAARAGNAANAVQATSAWYDGTGRLISSLPDSAAVSSIASSYAESAVSSKADASSLSSFALSSDVSGVIDTVSANSASWGAGASLPITGSAGDDTASYGANSLEFTRYDTAGEPDIRTAILSPDSLWMDYTLDGDDHTSMTLNESMLDFGDSDGDHIVDAYSIDTWNSAVETVANNSATWGQGGVDSATVSAIASSYAESAVSSKADSSALSSYAKSADVSAAVNKVTSMSGNWNTTYNTVFYNSAYWNSGYTTVRDNSASWASGGGVDSATVSSIASSYAESAVSSKQDSSAMTAYALSADVSGTVDLVSSQSANWGAGASLPITGSTGTDSATYDVNGIVYEHEPIDEFDPHRGASISVDSFGIDRVTTDGDFYAVLLTDSGLSFTDQDGVHTVEASSIDSWNSAVDTVANNSASWGQGGVVTSTGSSTYWSAGNEYTVVNSINGSSLGAATSYSANSAYQAVYDQSGRRLDYLPDTAKVSAIASSYAESAMSSKLDSSASSSFYTTANESGFVDSAYVGSAVDSAVSSKADSSALSSYALSADVSGTVDIVSTQSANWGGSALALSAGPGVKLEKVGNTLVAGLDETVLFSGSSVAADMNLSEAPNNFAYMRVEFRRSTSLLGFVSSVTLPVNSASVSFPLMLAYGNVDNNSAYNEYIVRYNGNTTQTTFTFQYALKRANTVGGSVTIATDTAPTLEVFKVIGINRTAGV